MADSSEDYSVIVELSNNGLNGGLGQFFFFSNSNFFLLPIIRRALCKELPKV